MMAWVSRGLESHTRSIAKSVSYRLLGSLSTAGIFYALTGSPKLSFGAGAIDVVVKLAAYFVHERIWAHIPFGREQKSPEYEI
jgi:uncharacterized membrane protein